MATKEKKESKNTHTIASAIQSLSKKNDCRITASEVMVLKNSSPIKKHDLGNGSWGRIDFLRKMGLKIRFVESFN